MFSPPLLITNAVSGFMYAIKMSGEVYRDLSTSSTNAEGMIKQLELRHVFVVKQLKQLQWLFVVFNHTTCGILC